MGWTTQFDCHAQLGRLLLPAFLVATLLQPVRAATSPKELLATGQADEAIQTLEQNISHSSADAEFYNLLCRAYFMIDEWDRGIPSCERATKLDPQKSLYHLWLGRIYGEKADRAGVLSAAGLVKKIRNSFERAVELDPKSWEARTDLAEFYLEAPSIVGGGQDKARAQADSNCPAAIFHPPPRKVPPSKRTTFWANYWKSKETVAPPPKNTVQPWPCLTPTPALGRI